ncbi:hypothetical protein TRP8649_03153 [Pelagimonas phthalicica]|uniref:T6SS Phospholipase effector Tle1-like catalytic domain-containing protein n=1 Tax=Pelagimonas phthalicica TaxID=1037362 RepID=A0A238JF52_9RHOB|nr:DUF2235 domain-containing protein [Pelagimonas phthalicica]TDS91973.1 putative alpha/beta hydrolase family protein DUF2235 [Pelagimonas phthalicica]SMX29023.1 hypothetical protein TRP8649_03153 [Pelagimonas phthalicica]
MQNDKVTDRFFGWIRRRFASDHSALTPRRGPRDHVIILDGTASTLKRGQETNAGLTFRLLKAHGQASLYYEAGIQWRDWKNTHEVVLGRGINRQICRTYGYLASRYRPGDRIFLLGFSRGAYAVRSLAGVLDQVGLLKAEHATERNIRQIYRLYRYAPDGDTARAFAGLYCHDSAPIEVVGVWDTVKALGLRLPLIWRFMVQNHEFHNHELGDSIRHGFHALAYHETRQAFAPVLWACRPGFAGQVEQVWFRGTHGDVGGMIGSRGDSRPLANIPLVWMIEKLESCGLDLPGNWREGFPCNPNAPSVGTWQGFGKLFLLRRRRRVGQDPSESLHGSLEKRLDKVGGVARNAKARFFFTKG